MEEPKTVSKRMFLCLIFVLTIVFAIIETLLLFAVRKATGIKIDQAWVSGSTYLNIILAYVATDRLLKRFGLSRSGIVVEVQGRSMLEPEGEVLPGEVVEAHIPRGMSWFVLISCPIFAIFIIGVALFMSADTGPIMRCIMFGAGIFLGLGFVYTLVDWNNPQAKADAQGITGYPSTQSLRRKHVPWPDILTCELQTLYDPFGKPILIRPILKGHNGKPLMELNLMYIKIEDQERIVKYIRAKLPKTQIDPWEL